MNLDINTIITAGLGGIITLAGKYAADWLKYRIDNRNVDLAERKQNSELRAAVHSATLDLITPLGDRVRELENDNGFLRDALQEERRARLEAADKCSEDIKAVKTRAEQDAEHHRLAVNYANQRVERILAYISRRFGVEIDTDDLKTPPPLDIPPAVDPTPPIPTRSTFQDQPNAQPPDDAA